MGKLWTVTPLMFVVGLERPGDAPVATWTSCPRANKPFGNTRNHFRNAVAIGEVAVCSLQNPHRRPLSAREGPRSTLCVEESAGKPLGAERSCSCQVPTQFKGDPTRRTGAPVGTPYRLARGQGRGPNRVQEPAPTLCKDRRGPGCAEPRRRAGLETGVLRKGEVQHLTKPRFVGVLSHGARVTRLGDAVRSSGFAR